MMKQAVAGYCCAALVAGCAGTDEQKQATASARLEPRSGSSVSGTLRFAQIGEVVRVTGEITGHSKGPRAMHIHEKGDCSDDGGMNAGGHFNPAKRRHGGPYDPVKHAGDLGNVNFNDRGVARVDFAVGDISVSRDRADGIIGRAVIVHADRDDLNTDPAGNAGGRLACGVIK